MLDSSGNKVYIITVYTRDINGFLQAEIVLIILHNDTGKFTVRRTPVSP
jgi:hypothetical protein